MKIILFYVKILTLHAIPNEPPAPYNHNFFFFLSLIKLHTGFISLSIFQDPLTSAPITLQMFVQIFQISPMYTSPSSYMLAHKPIVLVFFSFNPVYT